MITPQFFGCYREVCRSTGAKFFGVMDDFGNLLPLNFYQCAVSLSD